MFTYDHPGPGDHRITGVSPGRVDAVASQFVAEGEAQPHASGESAGCRPAGDGPGAGCGCGLASQGITIGPRPRQRREKSRKTAAFARECERAKQAPLLLQILETPLGASVLPSGIL